MLTPVAPPSQRGQRGPRRRGCYLVTSAFVSVGAVLLAACSVGSSSDGKPASTTLAQQTGAGPASGRTTHSVPRGSLGGKPGWDCPGGVCDWSIPAGGSAPGPVSGNGPLGAPPTTASYRGDGQATPTASTMPGGRALRSAPLTAGSIDDNAQWDAYVRYRQSFSASHPKSGVLPTSTATPTIVRVANSGNKPVLGAIVEVADARGNSLGSAMTHSDGRVLFDLPGGSRSAFTATARKSLASGTNTFTLGQAGITVTLDAPTGAEAPRLDVLFLIDTTASMSHEIGRLKANVVSMTQRIEALPSRPTTRFAITAFRDTDVGEQFVTRTFNFTADAGAFAAALDLVQAAGGGDTPEAVDQGLADAIAKPDWGGDDTVKLIFLIGDAPPHLYGSVTAPRYDVSLAAAAVLGIKIFPIGASGLDDPGEFVFRQLAQATLARFVFLTYGADGMPPGTRVAHPVDRERYDVLPIDELVTKVVSDEIKALAG